MSSANCESQNATDSDEFSALAAKTQNMLLKLIDAEQRGGARRPRIARAREETAASTTEDIAQLEAERDALLQHVAMLEQELLESQAEFDDLVHQGYSQSSVVLGAGFTAPQDIFQSLFKSLAAKEQIAIENEQKLIYGTNGDVRGVSVNPFASSPLVSEYVDGQQQEQQKQDDPKQDRLQDLFNLHYGAQNGQNERAEKDDLEDKEREAHAQRERGALLKEKYYEVTNRMSVVRAETHQITQQIDEMRQEIDRIAEESIVRQLKNTQSSTPQQSLTQSVSGQQRDLMKRKKSVLCTENSLSNIIDRFVDEPEAKTEVCAKLSLLLDGNSDLQKIKDSYESVLRNLNKVDDDNGHESPIE